MNQRIGAVAGIAFIVLSFASLTLAPPPPGLDAGAAEVVDFFADNTGGLQAMGLLFAVSIAALTVWFGAVRGHVWAGGDDAPWGTVATVGTAVVAVAWLLIAALVSGVALQLDELDPSVVLFAGTLADMANFASQLGLALLALGVSVGAWERGSLPRWLVVVGAVNAAVSLVSTAGFATDAGWVEATLYAAWLPFVVWFVGVSVVLWRSPEGSTAGARDPGAVAVG
ncbi:MAG TPA: hypothetical protein PKA98_02205 [Acidimicrobiales bacterium]|nr:hypothetical protein [Acidimicrobiales bacterium]